MDNETMNTMNEEIMDEVTELTEVYGEVPEEISEGSGRGLVVKLVLAGLGAAALAVGIKKREQIQDAIDARRIKKLEKRGYTVTVDEFETDEFDDFTVDCDDDGEGNIIEIKGEEK